MFSDNFDDGNSDGWEVIGSTGWKVVNGEYGIRLNPGLSNTLPEDRMWDYNWKNIVYEVDMRGEAGEDRNILLKFRDTGHFIELHGNNSGLYLDKAYRELPGGAVNLGYSSLRFINGRNYHLKFEIRNNKQIKVYVDGELIFDVEEPEPLIDNWKVGLRAGTGGTPITEVWFDNVVVSELQELPSLAVPDIKQTSAPWDDDIYDHAQNWSSVPTIYRWGCALSSAVMVLRYFGHDVWPDQLNEWLKGQVDGYLRNGLINWLAVSRYTRIHDSPTSPTLEYRRLPASFDVLLNELKDGRPGILKEPGHFVVAKSKTPTSFGINDPFYLDRTTLESYGNSFLSLGSYLPSHTDLSYIQLVVDPQFNIQVFDSENNLLDGYTFLEEPIVDPETSQESTGFLRIFQFPKPEDGNYLIKVIGDGIYSLEAYVYSENGDVYYKKIEGVARGEDLVNLSYNDSQPEIEDFVSFESILDDVDSLCSLGKIRNKGTCIALKTQILNAKRFFDIGMRDKSVKMLEIPQQLLKNLSKVKPSLIDDEASLILLREIESLINLFS